MSILEAHEVCFKQSNKLILDKVNLKLELGKILTIIGPNGAGKTTLLKILLGILNPTTGHIVRNKSLRVGYVPQRLKLPETLPLSVRNFIKLANSNDLDNKLIKQTALLIDIQHLLDKQLANLSGGELQKVLIFQALLGRPNLLVLDEPAQGIDVVGQAMLYQKIDIVRQKLNCSVVLVSHDLHIVMANSDEVLCLNTHVCCAGHPEKVRSNVEFISLFGGYIQQGEAKQVIKGLAPYRHHHDHTHGEDCDN